MSLIHGNKSNGKNTDGRRVQLSNKVIVQASRNQLGLWELRVDYPLPLEKIAAIASTEEMEILMDRMTQKYSAFDSLMDIFRSA
ncbi:MAG: hypothetical protein IJ649_00880 [Oscillospiraceae bacterium]|nr:hypothetical protein [Oscillospiraceae bacterium]